MRSISTFDSEPLVTLSDVNLVFHTDVYRGTTWRDAFIKLARSPLSGLVNTRDRLQVAKNISLTIKNGERVGIVGVNGSGKTSLCRCIAGMYNPTSGKVTRRGTIRAVFDTSIGIQPELTGRENARLLASFIYPNAPDREQLIEEALTFSELGKFVDVPFRIYSNGMQARLCLSLISCRPCDLLILDEVFDGADAFFREKISNRILAMIEKSGAVIFVSHGMDQIRQVCNRLIVLEHGEVIYDGKVATGIEKYLGKKQQ